MHLTNQCAFRLFFRPTSKGITSRFSIWNTALFFLAITVPVTHGQTLGNTSPELTIIDQMVLYSPEAATEAGGSKKSLRPLIEHAVADANEAFENSQIHARIRLVHVGPTNQSEAGNTSADLSRLKSPDDGFYDQAHALRSEHGADLVTLIIDAPRSSGVGRGTQLSSFSTPSDQIAFTVVLRRSLVDTYTLAHEIGHNLGANHTRSDQGSPGLFPYSNGWIFSSNGSTYRTIMARQFGEKIGFFSNPQISFEGEPIGSPADSETPADNASTINHYAPKAENFRPVAHSNDSFVNAQIIEGFWTSSSGSNLQASAEANEPAHDGIPAKHSIWWQWTPPITDEVKITTRGTSFPHRIAVYRGTDFQTLIPMGSASRTEINAPLTLSLDAIAGQTLLLAIDSLGSEKGFVALQISKDNDDFENSIHLSGTSISSNALNGNATSEQREPGHGNAESFFSGAAKSVWWTWKAPNSGRATITTQGTSFTSQLGVYQGESVSDLTLIAEEGFDGSNGSWRSVSFDATANEEYHLAVDTSGGLGNTTGIALLHVDLEQTETFRFASITRTNNSSIQIEIQGFTEQRFQLEESNDLVNWRTLENYPPDALPISVELPTIGDTESAFFRITTLGSNP